MTDLSLAAELAVMQEAGYQARQPYRAPETEAELARRGCALARTMRPGQLIFEAGPSTGETEGFMITPLRPVTILAGPLDDTTSDPFGRDLLRFRARDDLTGRTGNLLYGHGGVVRVAPLLPWLPLAAEVAEDAAQLAAWDTDGGA